jgi:alanine-glyoxylate transaminase/serine-glyoxylate transaminase/serine-pyruvate transaminase
MDARFARHARQAAAFRAGCRALELSMLPAREAIAANTLSAFYYPSGVDAALIGRVRAEGIIMAGGLHPEAKAKYFRVGHMGVMTAADILAAVAALERALLASGYRFEPGIAVGTAQRHLTAR